MIASRLERITNYKGISPLLDRAIDYIAGLATLDLQPLEIEIAGRDCYASVNPSPLSPDRDKYESHREYIDVQLVLEGRERIYVADVRELTPCTGYDAEKDAILYADAPGTQLDLARGHFAVFFPWDAHKPGCTAGEGTEAKKMVIKVRTEAAMRV